MFILTSEEYKHILDVSSTHCLICNNILDKVSKIMTVRTKLACFVFKARVIILEGGIVRMKDYFL